MPEGGRRSLRPEDGPFVEDGHLFTIIEAIDEIARETGKSVTQIALNWLLQRPTVASLIIGARNETQLSENFGAIGWALTADQVQRLDKASRVIPTYPYWHQEESAERNPFPAYFLAQTQLVPIANCFPATWLKPCSRKNLEMGAASDST